jgi:sulfur-oxidizing protein SoxA
MKPWRIGVVLYALAVSLLAPAQEKSQTQTQTSEPTPAPWPTTANLSGMAFLPLSLKALNNDPGSNPVSLWLDRGALAWTDAASGPSCASCHGQVPMLRQAVVTYPRLAADGKRLINLEDQIQACRTRSGKAAQTGSVENEEVLALSALLHQTAKGLTWDVKAPSTKPPEQVAWQAHLNQGASLFAQRMGRMNLACLHCHDQNIGRQLRADVISPGHPTGFPVYRMSWQGLGSVERRLRACFSGVQAQMPPPGDPVLRDLELYLKVRASGMPLDGPSIRR